jgi:ubiquinone biosynthesis protein COQ4
MADRRFEADDRPPVRFLADPELAYVATRAREAHDLWHVLFDCHTNVFGELALKALEFVHTGLPMAGLAVAGAQFRLSAADRSLLQRHYLPWALRAGRRCRPLMCIHYEAHLEEDLEELRGAWRIVPAPPPPPHLAFLGGRPKGVDGGAGSGTVISSSEGGGPSSGGGSGG